MKKKVFKILIAALLLVGFIPNAVYAEETLVDDTTYTVTVNARNNNRRLSNVTVMISQNNETVTYGTTNNNGQATFELGNGTYTAVIGYVSGNYSYYGRTDFTVNGDDISVTVNVDSEFTKEAAKEVYDNTSYFDHLDIRVNGFFTTGTEGNTTTHAITLKNVKLLVTDGSEKILDTTFTDDSETYEWRVTRISVPKTAKVSLVFDILVNGETARENYTYSFEGEDDFIQAIINCDQNQGLDFIIDPAEIVKAAYYSVSYQWKGLPEGLANTPSTTDGYTSGDSHIIDTEWTKGKYVVDYTTNKAYIFSGWTEWSDEDTSKTKIGDDVSVLDITSDTIIYGSWTTVDLEVEESHIIITKKINGDVNPSNLYFTVLAPRGNTVVIPYSSFTNGSYILPVYTEGKFVITEHDASIPGYSLTTTIDSTMPNTKTADSITVEVKLNYIMPTDSSNSSKLIGTVDFTNTYTKKYVTDPEYKLTYPTLYITKEDTDRNALSGAIFRLTNTSDNSTIISSETDKSGYTVFKNLKPGVYKLVETKAPFGYYLDSTEYTVTVSIDYNSKREEYVESEDAYIIVYDCIISIEENDHFNATIPKLTVFNKKITGSLTISKDFGANSDINKNNFPTTSVINVKVTGPNYSQTITLNKDNNWTVTLDNLAIGNYTVEEVASDANIAGYSLVVSYGENASFNVTFDENKVKESVTVINTYIKNTVDIHNEASLTVKKTNKENNPLANAKFGLYDLAGNLVKELTTDENGIIEFTGFKQAGEYILKEIAAPEGYKKLITEWKVVISLKDGKTREELDIKTNTYKIIYDWVITIDDENYKNQTLTVVNERMTGNLVITKEVVYKENSQIIDKDKKYNFIVTIGDDIYEITLGDKESKIFENIAYGTSYSVVEVIPSDALWQHTSPENNKGTINSEQTKVEMVNTYNIKDENVEETNPEDDPNTDIPTGDVPSNDDSNIDVPSTDVDSFIYTYILLAVISIVGLIAIVKNKEMFD